MTLSDTSEDQIIDFAAVTGWMDDVGLGSGPLDHAEPLAGGTQNIMVSFMRSGKCYILRRGPRHLRAGSNQIMGREITPLAALARTDVPHTDSSRAATTRQFSAGAVFYLMEPIDGYNAALRLPDGYRDDAHRRHRMGLSMVEALAALGGVDHKEVGLSEYGQPEGFLERQVPRWMGELPAQGLSGARDR